MDAASLTQALPAQAAKTSSAAGKPGNASKAEGFDNTLKQLQSSADESKKDTEATPEGLIAQATVLDLVLNALPKQDNASIDAGTPEGTPLVDSKVIAANLPAVTQAFGEVFGTQSGQVALDSADSGSGVNQSKAVQVDLTDKRAGKLQLTDGQAQQIAELLSEPDLKQDEVKSKALKILGQDVCNAEPKVMMPKCGTQSDFPDGDPLTNLLKNKKSENGGQVVKVNPENVTPVSNLPQPAGVNVTGSDTKVPDFKVVHEHKDGGSWDLTESKSNSGSVTVVSNSNVPSSGTATPTEAGTNLTQTLQAMKAELVVSASQLTAANAPAPQVSGETLAAIVESGRANSLNSKSEAVLTSKTVHSLVMNGEGKSKAVLGTENMPKVEVPAQPATPQVAKNPEVDATAKAPVTTEQTVDEPKDAKSSKSKAEAIKDSQSTDVQPKTASKVAVGPSERTILQEAEPDEKKPAVDDLFGKPTHAVIHQPISKADAVIATDTQKPLLDAKVLQETIDKITDMVAANRPGTVTLKLHPEDLGTVDVTVKQIGNRTDVQVAASDDRVRTALQSHRTDLMQSLQTKGVEVGTVSLATNTGDLNPGHSQQQSSQATRQEFEQSANLRAFSTPAPVSVPQGTLTYGSMTTVDYTA